MITLCYIFGGQRKSSVVYSTVNFFSELYTIVQRLAALRTAMSWECRMGPVGIRQTCCWDLVQARKESEMTFSMSGLSELLCSPVGSSVASVLS